MTPARLGGVLSVLALLLGADAAAAARPRAPLATVSSTTETQTIVTRVDPRTLAPFGQNVELDEYHGGWSYSPGGSKVAFGKSPAGGNSRGGIHIVDVDPIRLVQIVDTPAYVRGLAWLAPRRLVGLVAGIDPLLADPVTGEILERASTGYCEGDPATVATSRELVWLAGGRLVTGDARGQFRVTRIGGPFRDCWMGGLAVDPAHRRAWVVAGPRRLTTVSLRGRRVARHPHFSGSGPTGASYVEARWIGRGRMAALHLSRRRGRGIEVLDTRARTRRTIDKRAAGMRFARGTLLAWNGDFRARRPPRGGVRGYTRTGRLRFHVLRRLRVEDVQVAGHYAWLIGPAGVTVVDVRTGRTVGRSRARVQGGVELLARPQQR